MNYLAHLYLAQPNADSYFGNLLGDFGGYRHVKHLPLAVEKALDNHYLVDKFTDQHPIVTDLKSLFSTKRKRFASIAIDVIFDHFLIKHWRQFHPNLFNDFKCNSYTLLNERITEMPDRMQKVITHLTQNDWFKEYETTTGVAIALDNIAKRIRFTNNFAGAMEDISNHYEKFDAAFLAFFPQLIQHVNQHKLESSSAK